MNEDTIRKILLPYWMRNPDHFEFQIFVQTNKVFRDPQGNPHTEPAMDRLKILVSVNCEAMPELPKKEKIEKLIENMACRFQIDLLKETEGEERG